MPDAPEPAPAAADGAPAQISTPPRAPALAPAMDAGEVRRRRLAAAIVALASGALLGVAWSLRPAADGFGTHQALGLPACSWPERFGVPCPSCGMTTAFAHAAKGQLLASFAAQPMGCALALFTGMALVGSLWTLATGRTVWPVYERLWNARGAWLLGLVALLAWGYKIVAMRGFLE